MRNGKLRGAYSVLGWAILGIIFIVLGILLLIKTDFVYSFLLKAHSMGMPSEKKHKRDVGFIKILGACSVIAGITEVTLTLTR